ncbi:MAG: transcriptional regulator NrdR [Clostridia bacterium]|nr:transcriptional regulator NrdR [Clostridia bacterium]
MRCTFCGFEDSKVLDSRPVDDGHSIRRRRECLNCGKRFTTYERVEEVPLIVVKRDNRREVFDSNKILDGLIKACDKRSVPLNVLEQTVADIEKELRNSLEREISSRVIGEMIMERLKHIDAVAYVRFASVYRQFEDIYTFMEELRRMVKENNFNLEKENSAFKAKKNDTDIEE